MGSILASAPIFMGFPMLSMLSATKQEQIDETGSASVETSLMLWGFLLLLVSVRTIMAVIGFTAAMIMISNSVRPENLGTVNGLGQMAASGFRALGPFLAGSLWSWSLINGLGFPFDQYFVFTIAAGICVLGFIVVLFMPPTINNPPTQDDDERQAILLDEPYSYAGIQ